MCFPGRYEYIKSVWMSVSCHPIHMQRLTHLGTYMCLPGRFECIKSAWMSVVLHQGFQFPVDYPNFQSAQLIEGKDVQWTLGALIYRTRFLPLRLAIFAA